MTLTGHSGDAAASPLAAAFGLADADLVAMYRTLALARAVDERMWILNRAGRIPFVISGQGHEGAQVGLAWPLRRGHDWIAPFYRSIATCLAFGMTPRDLMLAQYAKAIRPGLRRAPDARPLRQPRAPPRSASRRPSPRRSCTPSASRSPRRSGGWTRSRWRSWGRGAPTRATSTRRSTSRRSTGCRSCSSWRTTATRSACRPRRRSPSRTSRCGRRATASRASWWTGPTCSPATRRVAEAVERARSGGGPTLIEAKVTRLTAHSSDDQQTKYRSEDDLAEGRAHDPLPIFRDRLRDGGHPGARPRGRAGGRDRRPRRGRDRLRRGGAGPRPRHRRWTGSTPIPRPGEAPPPWHPARERATGAAGEGRR